MVPKVASSGRSFQGAYAYYGHDKKADTTERVSFTHTLNMRTENPDKAVKVMAYTALYANELKHHYAEKYPEKEVKKTGRKLQKPVYAFSLSWGTDEKPTHETMRNAAKSALSKLGFEQHQAILIGHNDTDHPHIHIIVNRVDPITGMAASTSKDRNKLSQWAQRYEEQQGKIRCHKRVENNERREELAQQRQHDPENTKGKIVRGRDPIIQKAWQQSDNGRSFAAALEEQGYLLAKGDKRGVVVIDPQGKPINPARHIEGENGKNIRVVQLNQRLSDLDMNSLQSVLEAKEKQKDLQHFDRDKYQVEQDRKIEDAAIDAEKDRMQEQKTQGKPTGGPKKRPAYDRKQEKDNRLKAIDASRRRGAKRADNERIKQSSLKSTLQTKSKSNAQPSNDGEKTQKYESFAEELDQKREDEHAAQQKIDKLRQKLDQAYDRAGTEQRLKAAQDKLKRSDTLLGRVSGRHEHAISEEAVLKKNLDNIRQRENEQMDGLKKRIKEQQGRGGTNRDREAPSPDRRDDYVNEILDEFKKSSGPSNDNADKDKEQSKQQEQGRSRDDDGYER